MNRVDLIGRLVRDPELKRSQNGNAYTSFTLAVDRMRKAEGQQEADFISCKAFGKTAENLCQYMHKGQKIAVCGSIATGSYTDKDQRKVFTTDVMVQEIQYLEPRNTNNYQPNAQQSYGYQQANLGHPQAPQGYDQPLDQGRSGYIRDEDLPF